MQQVVPYYLSVRAQLKTPPYLTETGCTMEYRRTPYKGLTNHGRVSQPSVDRLVELYSTSFGVRSSSFFLLEDAGF